MLSIEDFKKITLDDKLLFKNHYSKYPPIHSDNVFTTLVSWMHYSNYKFAYIDDNLFIMSEINNQIQFRPPSGKKRKYLFDQILNLAKKQNSNYPIEVIDLETKDWFLKNYPKLEFNSKRDFFDYIYLSSDLSNLLGKEYSKIRNRLNKFKKNFVYSVENITEENISEIQEFLKRWCLWKDCESDLFLKNEKKAIIYSMYHFFELELYGIVIRIKDKIEAISVFEKINPDTALVHYEKGSPDFDGIYKAINQETAKFLEKKFKFINRESDMGIPGLRRAKLSYRPYKFIEVFNIDKKSMSF